MIISKTSLQALHVTKNDKVPVLNNIHITEDGTVVGSNGKTIVLVSPVIDKARKPLLDVIGDDKLSEPLTVPEEVAKDVLKNIPKDTQFKGILEHCNVKEAGENNVEFHLTDGKRPKVITGKKWKRKYIEYGNVLKRISSTKKAVRVVLNRKRLMSLLDTIDKACPDTSGNSPVYIEFSEENDIIVRAQNLSNRQRIIAIMQSYKGSEGVWLDEDEWERNIWSAKASDVIVDKNIDDTSMQTAHSFKKPKVVRQRKIPKVVDRKHNNPRLYKLPKKKGQI